MDFEVTPKLPSRLAGATCSVVPTGSAVSSKNCGVSEMHPTHEDSKIPGETKN
jgi:hypothetical protein